MIRVGIVGCCGKLAKQVIDILENNENCVLTKAIARKGNLRIGDSVSSFTSYRKNSVIVSDDLKKCDDCDVLIDVSNRDSFMNINYDSYLYLKKPLIIATTGFSDEDNEKIEELSKYMSIIKESNFSIELFYFIEAVKKFLSFDREIDVSVVETHHTQKKDAPSGTALLIKNEMLSVKPDLNIDIVSVRVGSVCGEHSVIFATKDGEEITFVHKVTTRNVFAAGIVDMIPRILERDSGMYRIKDILYNE